MIRLNAVSKTYLIGEEKVQALRNITLQIESGEFVVIVGPSGSGKSTLLHLIGGLDSPTSGEVEIEGGNLKDLTDAELSAYRNRDVGFVFQEFNLLPHLNIVENVQMPLTFRKTSDSKTSSEIGSKKKAIEILNQFDLKKRLKHNPNQISGGQKQRVAIARALINHPKMILADEPTGNLDSQTGKTIIQILKKLHRQQKITMIIVTHDRDIAEFADRVIEIKDGQILKKSNYKKFTS